MKRNGFTLIELLVVVAIIGILAAVGVVAYNGYTSAAKKAASKANFKMITKAVSEKLTICSFEDQIILKKRDGSLTNPYDVGCNTAHFPTQVFMVYVGNHLRGSGVTNVYSGKPDIWLGCLPKGLKIGEMCINGWDEPGDYFPSGYSCPSNKPCVLVQTNWDGDHNNYLSKIISDPRY